MASKEIRRKIGSTKLMSSDMELMLKVGGRAYLIKDVLDKELLDAIRTVHAGGKSISAGISIELAEHATDELLTLAEVRVLYLIAEGKANKEIAGRISTSEATVKGQIRNILAKLGAQDRTHAVTIGLKTRNYPSRSFVSEMKLGRK